MNNRGDKTESQEDLLAMIAEVGGIRLEVGDEKGTTDAGHEPIPTINSEELINSILERLMTEPS